MAGTKKLSATKSRSAKGAVRTDRSSGVRKAASSKHPAQPAPTREGRISKMSAAKAVEVAKRAGIIDDRGNLSAAYKHR